MQHTSASPPPQAAFHRYQTLYLAQPPGHVAHFRHRHMTSLPLCRANLPFNSNTNPGAACPALPARDAPLLSHDWPGWTHGRKEGRKERSWLVLPLVLLVGCGRHEHVRKRRRVQRCCGDRWDLTVSCVCGFCSLSLCVALCLLGARNVERAYRNRKFELW